jgi:hypothetical protein
MTVNHAYADEKYSRLRIAWADIPRRKGWLCPLISDDFLYLDLQWSRLDAVLIQYSYLTRGAPMRVGRHGLDQRSRCVQIIRSNSKSATTIFRLATIIYHTWTAICLWFKWYRTTLDLLDPYNFMTMSKSSEHGGVQSPQKLFSSVMCFPW